MRRSPILLLPAILLAALPLPGCVHVRMSAASLMSPDEPPASAHLATGYIIEDSFVQRANRMVAVTRAHADGNRVVIIFCGGDGFHRSREGGSVLTALARHADVVLFDYPGFGTSTGTPDPDSVLDNARAVLDYVAQLPSTGEQKQVVYGFSLGGVVAAQLAGERPVDGLVLESTAPDIVSWVRTQVPWFAIPFIRIDLEPALARIDSVKALGHFRGTVLLLAGERDKQAPASLSRDMLRRLSALGVRAELHEIPDAAHGEIYKTAAFATALNGFLAGL